MRDLNLLTEQIIGAAIEVHRQTGPGLLESVYEECLCYELNQLGLAYQRQVAVPVAYKKIKLDCGYRLDLLVEDSVIVEVKAVEQVHPVHSAQLLTYLKLLDKSLGLPLNFNETVLKRGIRRVANDFQEPQRLCVSASNPDPRNN